MTEKLALEGGKPVRRRKFPEYHAVMDEKEIRAVTKVLKSNTWRRGPVVEQYERDLEKYFGVKHALAVSDGTAALHVAMAALGLGPGDEIITTPYTFLASAGAALYQNAIPKFADIEQRSYDLDPAQVEKTITDRTKGIVVVHLAGHPANMDPFLEIAEKHGLWLIEDTAQASGAKYKNRFAGTIGNIGTFSTVDGKIMSTGEGGFCLTNDDELAQKMGSIHNFYRAHATSNIYDFYGIGYNYRMTEFQAAIGREQLKKLDRMIEMRRRNASYLTTHLRKTEGVSPPSEETWAKHVFYYYALRVDTKNLGVTRQQFEKALTAEGIPISPGRATTLINRTQLFTKKIGYGGTNYPFSLSQGLDYSAQSFPVAEATDREVFWLTDALPILTRHDLDDIIAAVEKVSSVFLKRASSRELAPAELTA
ncbi:MAG: DegT/DnrJ/EryC1/StrS family aminotransferase [Candidatus Bathyarchaeia archaeon]|jgi:dTDP-4-amino-4,6-dideoxygalactose transaminase